jgi:Secretion system C-terminal sorting domain
MNSDIQTHYKVFADSLKASLSPVGTVWANIRQQHPSIELFDPDESHPSVAGTYAAACSFYAAIFRSDPTQITFNGGLSDTDAEVIRQAAKVVVFDNLLNWNIGLYDHLLDSSCQALGIDDNTKDYWILSPNPVKDVLTIRFSEEQGNDTISIYSILGELIKKIDSSSTTTIINLSELPSGMYILKSMNTKATCKIVKQ